MGYQGPGFWEYVFIWGLPALFEGLAIFAGVYFGVSWALKRYPKAHTGPAASAEDIVRERYARGEIPRSEYEQMREDLQTETEHG